MRLLVTGGCGYKGTVLVPKLLAQGHTVTVIDTMWFGNLLEPHPNLRALKHDVRDVEGIDLSDIDAIIHLSSIANDPCGDLNPKLTWEVSALATMQLADKAARNGIKQIHIRFFWKRLRRQGRAPGHRGLGAEADFRIQ